MAEAIKSRLAAASEFLGSASGYALAATGIVALLFVDVTGRGSLWRALRCAPAAAQEDFESPNATRVIRVPARPDAESADQDRMLVIRDVPRQETIAAVYPVPDALAWCPSADLIDAPAAPRAGRSTLPALKGQLRAFTIYGRGEQTTSAAVRPGGVSSYVAARTPVAEAGSDAPADTVARSRPGVGASLRFGERSSPRGVRNAR